MLRRDRMAAAGARWHWLIPIAVIFGLLTPLLFTDRTFSNDWGNHLWLIWVQGLNIEDLGEPSYFLQTSLGAFYPYYAFYGGSIYAVLGAVSSVTSPEVAVLVGYAGALAAAYLGWTWIARQLGVRGWQAQLPGCIAVTAPLAVTNLYGRGDIPEAIATLMIPLVAASAMSMFREEHIRLPSAVAYVIGIVILTGTHTLTLVWGTLFLLVCAVLLVACYWRAAKRKIQRGAAVVGLTVLGAGINAWILTPLVLYHTRLAESDPDPIGLAFYTNPENLFNILRDVSDTPWWVKADVSAQLPVLALLWALFCGAAYWHFLSPANRRVALGLLGLGGALLVLVLSPSLIEELPRVLRFIQFPYRVLTYVDLCLVGLVTLALAAMQRDPATNRLPVFALVAIAVFSFGLSVDQSFRVRSWLSGRDEALVSSTQPPRSWYATLQFADGSAPIVKPTLPPLGFPIEGRRDIYRAVYPAGSAGTAETNIATGPYLVDVNGARPVGRSGEGRMVLRLPASRGAREVVVTAGWGAGITLGRWLTVISLIVALAALGIGATARVGKRRER
ncbi:MAG TPA: hypothetical protein VFM94_11440 [Solirubrobacterales bacterium]|nr:hypothetical protein [Solirubrobacterales bacterium]